MRNSILLLFTIVLLFSCSEKKPAASHEDLMQAVMAAHDEVMPLMGDIMKYKKQVGGKMQELQAVGDSTNQVAMAKLQEVTAHLDSAHDQMMDWMHDFSDDFEGMKEDDILKYLNDEKVKIQEIGAITNKALQDAAAILQQ